MKKLVLSALALIGFVSFSIAQTTPAKTTTPPAKPKMEAVKKDAPAAKVVKMPAAKPAATAAAKPAAKPAVAAAAGPNKKDGTPDKRFKANKTAPAAAGPLKKDGTPDKRFKANKKS
jgi:hypothetical protein